MPINSLGVSAPRIPLENRETPAPVQQHTGDQGGTRAQALPNQPIRSGSSNFRSFLARVRSCIDCTSVDEGAIVSSSKYRASLDAWVASANPDERPARESARERIVAWQAAGRVEAPLNFSLEKPYDNDPDIPRLRKLPPLPPRLQVLNAAGHKLKKLPASLPKSLTRLNVSYNKLQTLPAHLPPSLTQLNVSYNKLEKLPASLPVALTRLNVSYNELQTLPAHLPASLMELNVSGNYLRSWPARLPASLTKLNVSLNGFLRRLPSSLPPHLTELQAQGTDIENLPDDLPDSLMRLNASYCQITEIPASVLAAASRREAPCEVDLSTNPLSEDASRQIQEHNRGVIRNGAGRQIQTGIITITDDTNEYGVGRRSATLEQAVQEWYDPDPDHETARRDRQTAWQNIQQEAQAHAHNNAPPLPFWALLDSLNRTAEHGIEEGAAPETSVARRAARTAFRERVTTLLDAMEKDKELRETCFSIALDASESCHDKVALRFDQMEQAHLTLRAARGELTQEEVFKSGLGTFKLEMLDELAKAEALAIKIPTEELEIVLYYRTKLADKLGLPNQTKNMVNERFVLRVATEAAKNPDTAGEEAQEASNASEHITRYLDVEATGKKVQEAASDPEQITRFLTEWAPWQKTLERIHPEAFDIETVEKEKAELHQKREQQEKDCSDGHAGEGWLQAMNELMEKYNHMEDILLHDSRKRLTEEFLKANTALWSC